MSIAANAAIGTLLEMTKFGNGSKMSRIGATMIGNVGIMVTIGKVSRNVMVRHVLILIIIFLMVLVVVVMVVFVITTVFRDLKK